MKYKSGSVINMTKEFKKGDKVKWESSQGEVIGEVQKKLSSPMDIKGHHVAASEDNPEYLVKSEKTGKEAAHKPESLKKIEE
jgi:Hypervirulence associated proteins TUDOR domain